MPQCQLKSRFHHVNSWLHSSDTDHQFVVVTDCDGWEKPFRTKLSATTGLYFSFEEKSGSNVSQNSNVSINEF
jgi:hypothetical protein